MPAMPARLARPRITLDQLHTFLTVAETGNQRRAAEQLHLSGAAVSEQLRLLEAHLGVRLFERFGRGTHLTQPGKALVEGATAALQATGAVEAIATGHRGLERGRLTIGAAHTLAQYRIPVWLGEFFKMHPQIEVELQVMGSESAAVALGSGAIDLALVGGAPPRGRFEQIEVGRDALVIAVAAAHPLATSTDLSRDLPRHRYLMRGEGSGTEQLARAVVGSTYGMGPVQRLGLGSVPLALLAGLGYAVMPAFAVEQWVDQGRV